MVRKARVMWKSTKSEKTIPYFYLIESTFSASENAIYFTVLGTTTNTQLADTAPIRQSRSTYIEAEKILEVWNGPSRIP